MSTEVLKGLLQVQGLKTSSSTLTQGGPRKHWSSIAKITHFRRQTNKQSAVVKLCLALIQEAVALMQKQSNKVGHLMRFKRMPTEKLFSKQVQEAQVSLYSFHSLLATGTSQQKTNGIRREQRV